MEKTRRLPPPIVTQDGRRETAGKQFYCLLEGLAPLELPRALARRGRYPGPLAKPRLDQSNTSPIRGYGHQGWIPDGEDRDRPFQAVGIRGQAIGVNPTKRIVIAQFSAWPTAGARSEPRGESNALFQAIVEKLSP